MKFKSDKEAGVFLAKQKQYKEAMPHLVAAMEDDPCDTDVLMKVAVCKAGDGDLETAHALCNRVIQLDASKYEAYHLLGSVASFAGEHAQAEALFDKCLSIAPNLPAAMWNKAQLELMRGDYKNGFAHYLYGRQCKVTSVRAHGKEWDGSPVDTLFVWCEQGQGDLIQMLRYVPETAKRAKKVVIEVYKPMVALADFQDWPVMVVAQPEDWHNPYEYDAHIGTMCLPRILGIESPSQVSGKAYLKAPPVSDAKRTKSRIGVCWKGTATHENDAQRSIPEELLRPLARFPLVSLQKGETLFEWESVHLGDFAQTAAVLKSLDLLITVDTAVAHLAGALGVPTWMFVPLNGEWRWGKEEKSCWYDSVRLLRGDLESGFAPVVAQVAKELNAFIDKAPNLGLSGHGRGLSDRKDEGREQCDEATRLQRDTHNSVPQVSDPDHAVQERRQRPVG